MAPTMQVTITNVNETTDNTIANIVCEFVGLLGESLPLSSLEGVTSPTLAIFRAVAPDEAHTWLSFAEVVSIWYCCAGVEQRAASEMVSISLLWSLGRGQVALPGVG